MIQSIEEFDATLQAQNPEATAEFLIIAFIPEGSTSHVRRITAFSKEPNVGEIGQYLDELKADEELVPFLEQLQLQFSTREQYIEFYNLVTADMQTCSE